MTNPGTWTDDNIQTAVRMWKEGSSPSEIGSAIGTGKDSFMGFKFRNKDLFPPKDKSEDQKRLHEMALMWGNGASMTEIGVPFGLNRGQVSGIISRNRDLFGRKVKTGIKANKSHPDSATNRRTITNPNAGSKQAEYIDPKLDDFELSRLPGINLVENNGCMYPLTSGSPHMFCGHFRFGGKRYCKHHVDKTTGYAGIDISYRTSYDKNIRREELVT